MLMKSVALKTNVLVIGSGPGGAVTACMLAEAGREVVIIEEGPDLPLESCPAFSSEEMAQKYRKGGLTPALGRPKVAYVEACCAGGGSEINSGLYHRPPDECLELWRREFQLADASTESLRPICERIERDLSVSRLSPPHAASLKLHKAASQFGWSSVEVPRWVASSDESSGDARISMTRSYLRRARLAGALLHANTRVSRIRREGGGWMVDGVRFDARRGELPWAAWTRHLFISAGAIQTPAILRRSGFTRCVGNSLQMHPTVKVVAVFPEEINFPGSAVPVHQVKEFSPRFTFACSISSPCYLAMAMLDHPKAEWRLSSDWRRSAIYYCMISPEGVGRVRPLPFTDAPLVQFHCTPGDLRSLATGLQKLLQALLAAGAQSLYPTISHSPVIRHDDDRAKLPAELPRNRANLMTIHLFSSCPMGENRYRCPADSFGRLRNAADLWLADASLLCTALGVNPQGSVMAFAMRNALHYLASTPSDV
jgi:choline dehydrogenase-like flavoprotein